MAVLNLVQAVNHALRDEMKRNDQVIVLGEDVGVNGGVFRATEGLFQEFGPNRVIDTPLAESGIIGVSIGMALYGLRPVPEIQFMDFIYPGFDQIQSELAKFRYRSGGQYAAPVVIRAPYGGGIKGAHYHSQSTEAFFAHTPGLKVVIPATPYDAKGLLTSALRDPDPVIFLEPKKIYRTVRGEVPDDEYTVPIGKANVAREGHDVVIFAYGTMLHVALEAADLAAGKGINAEVVDLRTILPFDIETIISSVKKTGRVVILHEACKTCGFGAEIAAQIAERCILNLKAPIVRVGGFDVPFPYALEEDYMPNAARVLNAVEQVYNF
ncbi:MAG TPA: alpha-ketoacid dehydrogenase subunit beta [Candidatus Dormibacteraeota bacterium]|nr:alpha-ketoacid dehydrogenase subunit beta [Candidatus Dormibacteraeota bacterium]